MLLKSAQNIMSMMLMPGLRLMSKIFAGRKLPKTIRFWFLLIPTDTLKKMYVFLLTAVTFSFSKSTISWGFLPSAKKSKKTVPSHMIWIPSYHASSTEGYFIHPLNSPVLNNPAVSSKLLPLIFTRFIGHFRSFQNTLTWFRQSFINVQKRFWIAAQGFFITTAPTTFLKLNRNPVWNSMVPARNAGRIRLSRWGSSWISQVFLLLSASIPEIKTNRFPWSRLKCRSWRTLSCPALLSAQMQVFRQMQTAASITMAREALLQRNPSKTSSRTSVNGVLTRRAGEQKKTADCMIYLSWKIHRKTEKSFFISRCWLRDMMKNAISRLTRHWL